MSVHLVWFRADLRIHDNLALAAACCNQHARVLALFIATPQQWQRHGMAPRQADYLLHHLNGLKRALAEKGIPLQYEVVSDFAAQIKKVQQACAVHGVTHLFYNYQYELNEQRRDHQLEKVLQPVICQGFDDSVLLPPGSVMTGRHEMYKVFTPFKNACLRRLQEERPECVAAPSRREQSGSDCKLITLDVDYPRQPFDAALFPADEEQAIAQLRHFCRSSVAEYGARRDFPAVDGTSRLSACLALGILSPRQCLQQLLTQYPQALEGGPGAVWLGELLWREFYRHLIVYYPDLCRHKPFIPWTDNIQWQHSDNRLEAWQKGRTGYPIVDAAMRQLNETGWMHNRLRMIVASFLVKDLLIDWRVGERYFISQLIDGDLAANNGGWQWAASTGTDAAPYFRIFNPTTQGQKFDPAGQFIRQWLPELATLPEKAIHDPWLWADKVGVTLDYPRPLVCHTQARQATLAAYTRNTSSCS